MLMVRLNHGDDGLVLQMDLNHDAVILRACIIMHMTLFDP